MRNAIALAIAFENWQSCEFIHTHRPARSRRPSKSLFWFEYIRKLELFSSRQPLQ